jgi:hypothetical protein
MMDHVQRQHRPRRSVRLRRARSLIGFAVAVLWAHAAIGGDPFADAVVSFTPGSGAGFGADKLPGIVLGPPVGGGDVQGSVDVLSLGNGGSITLAFRDNVICDRPGPDFTVFENVFHAGSPTGPLFFEVGIVAVSQDGEHFVTFPYDPQTRAGLAGLTPVYSNPDNGIDPTDPAVSGGDHFDLADVGLPWAAYVRITDPGDAIPDSATHLPCGDSCGFDLDAIAAIHSCDPSVATPAPTATATATASVTPIINEATPTATPVAPTPTPSQSPTPPTATPTAQPTLPTPSLTPARQSGDLNGDGVVDGTDLALLIDALFGDDYLGAADVNADRAVTAADCPALIEHLGAAPP